MNENELKRLVAFFQSEQNKAHLYLYANELIGRAIEYGVDFIHSHEEDLEEFDFVSIKNAANDFMVIQAGLEEGAFADEIADATLWLLGRI